MSDTATFSVLFLVSMLRCLVGNDEDPVGEGVYPMSFEEVALFLANQTGFGFHFWNSATKSMDIYLSAHGTLSPPWLLLSKQFVKKNVSEGSFSGVCCCVS